MDRQLSPPPLSQGMADDFNSSADVGLQPILALHAHEGRESPNGEAASQHEADRTPVHSSSRAPSDHQLLSSCQEPHDELLSKDEQTARTQELDTIAKAAHALMSRRPLARALRDTAFAVCPLYFLIFAILTYALDENPSDGQLSSSLLAMAKYGPTIFGIMFAAVVGRFLLCTAAFLLERGALVGVIECLLGARTVFGAVSLPLRFRFMHPVMLLLVMLWIISPLGGQAALRVVGKPSTADNVAFTYLDTYVRKAETQLALKGALITAFSAALSSPGDLKRATQDIYGNVKIPMLERLVTEEHTMESPWYEITTQDDTVYSSLIGLPIIDGVYTTINSTFNLQSWYAYTNCTMADLKYDMYPPSIQGYEVIWNNFTLTSSYSSNYSNTDDNQPTKFRMTSMGYPAGVVAICKLLPTHVDTQVGCNGTLCKALAIRKSPPPFEGFSTRKSFNLEGVLSLISTASTMGSRYSGEDSPARSFVEQYFNDPDNLFTVEKELLSASIGNIIFSQRLTQVMNTMWLVTIAPNLVLGNRSKFSSSTAGLSFSQGIVTGEHEVIKCHRLWFWILILASIVMLSAGCGSIVIDIIRRGPDVLDDLTLGLRDNKYVHVPVGNSMDDGDDLARRSKNIEVRLGDVDSHSEVGHVALGTPSNDQVVKRLGKGRLYI